MEMFDYDLGEYYSELDKQISEGEMFGDVLALDLIDLGFEYQEIADQYILHLSAGKPRTQEIIYKSDASMTAVGFGKPIPFLRADLKVIENFIDSIK